MNFFKYSDDLTTNVGPKEYRRLADASDFYNLYGFKYVDVPWLVQQKVDGATKPRWSKPFHHHVHSLNHTFHLVASGEQSFLQTQYEMMKMGGRIYGKYQTITPCFRDEEKITDLKRIGFVKMELIDWDYVRFKFFLQYIPCKIIDNDQKDEFGVDIVSEKLGIELGSYGIRKSNIGGFDMEWVYGTGLAEPRLATAIEYENWENTAIKRERKP